MATYREALRHHPIDRPQHVTNQLVSTYDNISGTPSLGRTRLGSMCGGRHITAARRLLSVFRYRKTSTYRRPRCPAVRIRVVLAKRTQGESDTTSVR